MDVWQGSKYACADYYTFTDNLIVTLFSFYVNTKYFKKHENRLKNLETKAYFFPCQIEHSIVSH